jgi:UDP-N-acetylglucosamine 3-dehydrogenase
LGDNKRIEIALLGAGYWGTKIAREYLNIQNTSELASLVTIADVSRNALDTISSDLKTDGVMLTTHYQDVFEDKNVDAVHIAVPNEFHYEMARRGLESGKNVLIEKPMATTSREAFKLASLADEAGLVLQVGHIFRFNNALRFLKRILREGQLGRIYYANLIWTTYMLAPPKNRDIVFDLAPHPIDILNYLFAEWPIRVDAIGESFVRGSTHQEEVAFINLEFPETILANVHVSWIQQGRKERTVMVVCEKGAIECDALNQTVTAYANAESDKPIPMFPSADNNMPEFNPNNTIRSMQLHFIERIKGRGPQFNSAMIGARTVQVLEAITEAERIRQIPRARPVSPIEVPILVQQEQRRVADSFTPVHPSYEISK